MSKLSKIKFLVVNLLKGAVWMLILAGFYWLFSEYVFKENPQLWIARFYSNPLLIYSIYIGSEIFFGLFPPEIFMIWAFNKGDLVLYCWNVTFFAAVSYGAGLLAFLAGRYLRRVLLFRFLGRKFFSKYWPLVRKYGAFLIAVAALTPVPWATICLLIGSTEYRFPRFLLFALVRILRFILYGIIVYQGHLLS